jgi:hypothetical protein
MRIILSIVAVLFAACAVAAELPNGDAQIRARAGKSEIVITTSARFAGAIESLTWDGVEFINRADHGRELQSACSFDNSPSANAETFNPTEAGSRKDGAGPTSTGRLLEIAAAGGRLHTRTQMAFWLAPGERSAGQLARNTNTLSDYLLTKDVQVGFEGNPQALDYRVTFTVPPGARHATAQFEALTGYLPPEFEKFWQFDLQTGKLEPLGDGPGEIKNPVVLATADGRHAMGIFAPPQNLAGTRGPSYGRWKFAAAKVVKWNCVFRVEDATGIRTGDYSYRLLVPVGTLADVESMLRTWTVRVPAPLDYVPGSAPKFWSSYSPMILPGQGLAQHPFIYCGEWDTRKPDAQSIFIVRDGKIVWSYSIPMKAARGGIQEFDDVTLLPNGNVLFSRMSGAGMVSPEKKLVWNYDAPVGTEVHSAQYLGDDRVLIMRNGNSAQAMIFNIASNIVERAIPIPTTVTNTHAQFRHIRLTPAGTLLVPHMGEGRVVEYDLSGKPIWSVNAPSVWAAVRLKNGNTLLSGNSKGYVREVNPAGETVWEFTQRDAPDIKLFTIQGAERLANGNTVFCNWCPNGAKSKSDWPTTVQVLEVTPEKKIVWALRSWQKPADLGTATMIQLLDEPGLSGDNGQAR